MNTAGISAIRVQHRTLTMKQLLQRLRVDAALAAIGLCKEDLTVECWAEELGIAAGSGDLQEAVTRFRRAIGLFTAAKTNEWLAERGMTLDELIDILRPQVLRTALALAVVSDEEIERQFLEAARQYDRAEISLIITPEYGAAQELRFRVEEGGDFHRLARQYSSDAATAKSGGYAGLVARDDLEPETAAAVFGAATGTIVGPFERRRDYSLILVEGLYPAELTGNVAAGFREQLFQDRLEAYQRTLQIHEDVWTLGEE
ncbi:PPIC-type PPIASE domain-containing protein [Paenibacillus sp. UNCCL117]|uniref:peptidylprolyl isomerase n=1 Tax=unclassified Paenibacillus TaxID=185978 RepID=UPI000886B631|nr:MULTISPECIES: peptidylprolyl isomerase [unclassified Paenibacillus]SDC13801.1 PPIC-type PPIASE domain-containing protein [Paenibacillus sp. cl123]SFW17149.1 PPIC-type PPIASE domain-containing protein [Paenibacillus sp. UNCCL117]